MSRYDFSEDGTPDVLSGLDNSTEPNLQIWVTESGGILGNSPEAIYHTSGLNEVMDSKLADFDRDGNIDILVLFELSFRLLQSYSTSNYLKTLKNQQNREKGLYLNRERENAENREKVLATT